MSSELVFTPEELARVIGLQCLVGGALALVWALLPWNAGTAWSPPVVVLATMACVVGLGMVVLGTVPAPARALNRAVHACILGVQVLVAVGYAVTAETGSPILLFLLWTTAYAGILSRRARWGHATSTALLISAASATHAVAVDAAEVVVFLMSTIIVVTLVVSRSAARLHEAATHDALTGLPNRRVFYRRAGALLAERRVSGGGVAVALLDLDRFKHVNDSYGHGAGDALLVELARRLGDALGPDDLVVRLGGDEFAVLHGPSGAVDVDDLWARLSSAWAEPFVLEGRRLYVDGSAGIAIATPTDTPATLLRDADTAMYEAKALGTGRRRVFDRSTSAQGHRLLQLETGLREAVARGELTLVYQPVLDLADGRATGVEGLLRWTSPEIGSVGPDEFIPVAERCGMIGQLGLWVLGRAVADLASWRREGLVDEDFSVAVNVSAHQLTPELPEQVARLLAAHGVPTRNLALEVTESAIVEGREPRAVLDTLHTMGVTLLLDDFGTGHSSLTRLRELPLDVVKIDRSFVSGVSTAPEDRALVLGVVQLAHALGMRVIAEGIEEPEQLEQLRVAGCGAGQGYLLARPVPGADLVAALERAREVCAPRPVDEYAAVHGRT
ncbi:EAL domain-containing protein [Actinotalea sp. BY-33]|uniref:EAL domain-containing protein n=1 Tax=Actinotalea soli TaxID=2819234 RepID=A0A939RSX1_9CELL|nr:EAL domain-containing protein [Actinotalea soli]MBO1752782.1 EAL domain-containing protein [Actinotalea soli]